MMPFQVNSKQVSILGSNSKEILILQHHVIFKRKTRTHSFFEKDSKKINRYCSGFWGLFIVSP